MFAVEKAAAKLLGVSYVDFWGRPKEIRDAALAKARKNFPETETLLQGVRARDRFTLDEDSGCIRDGLRGVDICPGTVATGGCWRR